MKEEGFVLYDILAYGSYLCVLSYVCKSYGWTHMVVNITLANNFLIVSFLQNNCLDIKETLLRKKYHKLNIEWLM